MLNHVLGFLQILSQIEISDRAARSDLVRRVADGVFSRGQAGARLSTGRTGLCLRVYTGDVTVGQTAWKAADGEAIRVVHHDRLGLIDLKVAFKCRVLSLKQLETHHVDHGLVACASVDLAALSRAGPLLFEYRLPSGRAGGHCQITSHC